MATLSHAAPATDMDDKSATSGVDSDGVRLSVLGDDVSRFGGRVSAPPRRTRQRWVIAASVVAICALAGVAALLVFKASKTSTSVDVPEVSSA